METESFWLGETLRLARQTKMSNKVLADRAGVGYHWLTKVRQGVIKNPGIVSIERVYSVLVEFEEAAQRAA